VAAGGDVVGRGEEEGQASQVEERRGVGGTIGERRTGCEKKN
jgi:hypothetical protein